MTIVMGPSSVLLSRLDPPAVRVLNPGARAPFLIVCDHAGRETPARLGRLGAPPEAFERHIAWDIGAAGVAAGLAKSLGAAAVLQTYSRLVIDCNRDPARDDSIVKASDGVAIPGNDGLDAEAVAARVREIFEPYHAAVGGELDRLMGDIGAPVLVSVHSFTPTLGDEARPWGFGVLHEHDSPFSDAALPLLRAETVLPVGDNAPYAMNATDYTVPFHTRRRGLDYLELEIRQDLIAEAEGQAAVARMLARVLTAARANERPGG